MEATFCFVDLAGFTALTETHGAEAAAELIARFEAAVRDALQEDGSIVDVTGDAVFLISDEPTKMLAVLKRLWQRADAEPLFPALRAGLHHGEALSRDERWFGTAVNLAARVAAQARGGQVLATTPVASAAQASGIGINSLGTFRPRNLRDSIELFVLAMGGSALEGVVDPVCRMRLLPEVATGHFKIEGRDYWFCSLECLALFSADPSAYDTHV